MAKYLSVTVETTTEASDIVSLILIEEGSEGVSVQDAADIEFAKSKIFWDYISDNLPAYDRHNMQNVYVCGVFAEGFCVREIEERLAEFRRCSEVETGSLSIKTAVIDGEDFENEWKKYYEVMELGGVAIVPAWLEYVGGKPYVLINPGKAFGTGSHETTSMCIRLMQDFDLCGKTVFDVGCGSGILGLASLRLGAERAVLSDIDPQAVESACENALLNGLADRAEVIQCDLTDCRGADILLANLTADLLIKLRPLIAQAVKSGGGLVISGIINARADEVLSEFSEFKLLNRMQEGEWQAFSFEVK